MARTTRNDARVLAETTVSKAATVAKSAVHGAAAPAHAAAAAVTIWFHAIGTFQGQSGFMPSGPYGPPTQGQPGFTPPKPYGPPPQGQSGPTPSGLFHPPPEGQFGYPPSGPLGFPPQEQYRHVSRPDRLDRYGDHHSGARHTHYRDPETTYEIVAGYIKTSNRLPYGINIPKLKDYGINFGSFEKEFKRILSIILLDQVFDPNHVAKYTLSDRRSASAYLINSVKDNSFHVIATSKNHDNPHQKC